jgi:energy-coupling factor transporter ATP-binding protein EcfA2
VTEGSVTFFAPLAMTKTGWTCSQWSRTSAPPPACSSASNIRSRSPAFPTLQFLRESVNAQRRARGEAELSGADFIKMAREQARLLGMDADMLKRPVNVGFSGGEKKRAEMVQMGIIAPRFAVLDETDSGLDIDALRIVGDGINRIMRAPDKGVLLITHYERLLEYVRPDAVHVLIAGQDRSLWRHRARARARARRLCGDGGVTAFWIIIGCIGFMIAAGIGSPPARPGIADTTVLVFLLGLITVTDLVLSRFVDTGDIGWTVAGLLAFGFALDALYGLMAPERQRRRDQRLRSLMRRTPA